MDCSTPGSPSFTISQSLLRLMSFEAEMPSNHLILSPPSPPALNLSQYQGLYQRVSCSHQVAKYWSFSFSISPSNEYQYWFPLELTGLISLPSQGLSRVFSSPIVQKHQFFCYSAFFTIQLSHPYKTTGYLSLGLTITGASQGDLFHSGCVYLEIRNP